MNHTVRMGAVGLGLVSIAVMVTGCGMSLDTGSLASPPKPEMQVGRPISAFTQVSVPPLVGMPPQTQEQVLRSLNAAATPLDIALIRQGDGAAVLRGYANAVIVKGKLWFEYFWDVQGASSSCTGRAQGNDVEPATGNDPWAALTPVMIDKMAQKGLDLVKSCVPTAPAGGTAQPQGAAAQPPKT